MSIETPKSNEIKRLTTPLTFKDSKAYDSKGNLIKYSETLSDVRLIIEPKDGILSDNEILQYAPLSKAASKIRLKKGFGDSQDILLVNESLPWMLGLFYVVLICIAIPIVFAKITWAMVILLVIFIVPLIYLYNIFRLNHYAEKPKKEINTSKSAPSNEEVIQTSRFESLRGYEKEISNLRVVFDVKQGVVRDLIKKRFEPPQITYDKFITSIDKSEKLFNTQAGSALNIINMAAEDTPRIQSEIEAKIDVMKRIISQIEDLTNELVININSSGESTEEAENLLDNMEDLTDSVKEY